MKERMLQALVVLCALSIVVAIPIQNSPPPINTKPIVRRDIGDFFDNVGNGAANIGDTVSNWMNRHFRTDSSEARYNEKMRDRQTIDEYQRGEINDQQFRDQMYQNQIDYQQERYGGPVRYSSYNTNNNRNYDANQYNQYNQGMPSYATIGDASADHRLNNYDSSYPNTMYPTNSYAYPTSNTYNSNNNIDTIYPYDSTNNGQYNSASSNSQRPSNSYYNDPNYNTNYPNSNSYAYPSSNTYNSNNNNYDSTSGRNQNIGTIYPYDRTSSASTSSVGGGVVSLNYDNSLRYPQNTYNSGSVGHAGMNQPYKV